MINILPLLYSSNKKRFLIISIIVTLIILLILLLRLQNRLPPNQSANDFEGENTTPEYYRETLPDGGAVEYGSQHGPLSRERLNELKKIIEDAKK